MKNIILSGVLSSMMMVFSFASLQAEDLDNLLSGFCKKKIIDAEKSYENPANFDVGERNVRWRMVFQTGEQCPSYETWRTKESKDGKGHQLHLQFSKPVEVGTVMAFAGDETATKFVVKNQNIGENTSAGIVIAPVDAPVESLDFLSKYLQQQVLENWGGRKNVNSDELFFYQFSLSTIYAIKDKRVNIASAATAQISGVSYNDHCENLERPRNKAESLIDLSTFNYWRSNILKDGETATAELVFPKPVTVRELGVYFATYLFEEMPSKIEVTAFDSNGKSSEFGVFNDFSSDTYQGRHFYLMRNSQPEKKIKSLKFVCTPSAENNVVTIDEILVLAAPLDNPGLSITKSSTFKKTIPIPAKGNKSASAVIRDKTGRTIKNLTPSSGIVDDNIILAWDGTDNSGKIVPTGEYNLDGITVSDLHALYESTPYSPVATPWVTPSRRGGWLSDHHCASTIERFNNQLWVGAISAESGDTIMQLDFNGKKKWGVRWLNLAGAKFIRALNGKIYAATSGGWIGEKICVTEINQATKDYKTVFNIPINDKNIIPPANLPDDLQVKYIEDALTGFALNSEYIALAFTATNRVELYDFTGKLLKALSVSKPSGMRFVNDKLYCLAGDKLFEIDPDTGDKKTIIFSNLRAPQDFVISDNRIIVADTGDDNVKVFDKSGKLLMTIGSETKRKPGKYNPNTMFKPVSVAVDDKNRVWVAESTKLPKRISVWNLTNGKFIREYLGPSEYAAGSWMDPRNIDIYYAEGMTFKRRNGKWSLQAIYEDFDSETFNLLKIEDFPFGSPPERPIFTHGKLFMTRDRYWCNDKIWFGILGDDQVLHPYAAIGTFSALDEHFTERPPAWDGNSKGWTFLWVDSDNDGEMQWKELQFLKERCETLEWSARMGDDLAFYFMIGDNKIYKLAPKWKDGLPIYALSARKFIVEFPEKDVIAIAPLSKGRLLININPLTCVDENSGKILWTYPNAFPSNSHDSNLPKPGEIQHTLNIEGVVNVPKFGDIFMLNGNKGVRYLFTCDGIYIGKLFGDMRLSPPLAIESVKPGQDLVNFSLMDEAFNGAFSRNYDGKVRFSGGKNHCSIYEVTGLKTLRRVSKTITFTKREWKMAMSALRERKAMELNSRIDSAPVIKKISSPIEFSGNEGAWKNIPSQKFGESKKFNFTYQLALDDTFLYGAFKVSDPSPFVNNGEDSKMLFKTGDSVNLELGVTNDKGVSAGDVRILIAPYKNKNIAVIYRYLVEDSKTEPVIFGSPVGKVRVDKLEVLHDAEIHVEETTNGYFLEFKIPRKEILALSGNVNKVYGDVGVIYSDKAGNINSYDLFRYSPVKGVTVDVPSEIRLSPVYWHKFIIK